MNTKSNVFAYMRISTEEDREKQRFNRQEKALDKYAADNDIKYTFAFKEDKSGKNFTEREEWNRLESILKPGDTIVFKDITRFTREADNGYKKYMELLNNDINLIFLDNQTVCSSYIKELLQVANQQDRIAKLSLEHTVELMIIVELDRAEKERETIVKRTKDGLAASDKKAGRKPGSLDKMTPELAEDLQNYLNDRSITQESLMQKYKISRNTLKKYANIIKNSRFSS